MKNINNFKKAQKLVKSIAKIRKKLSDIGYNNSLKILPDFTECYARDRFNLDPAPKNAEGYDGIGRNDKKKYQVKYTYRKGTTKEGKEIFTHALDNTKPDKFNFLIAVILDKKSFEIEKVFKIPHNVCKDHLGYSGNKNSFRIGEAIEELEKKYRVKIF